MLSNNSLDLSRLVCPVCHRALILREESALRAIDCTGCGRRYPIVDGLPVLIESRATRSERPSLT